MAVASAVLLAVGTVFFFCVPIVAPSIDPQFKNEALYRPWSGWTSTYMVIHPLWFGVVFASVYLAIRKHDSTFVGWRGGARFGAGVFLVGSLPIYLLALASFQTSPEMIACWVAQSLCQYLAAGVAVGAVAG
jgi:hypothetical protein